MDPRQNALLDSVHDSIIAARMAGLYIEERRVWLQDAEAALSRVINTLSPKRKIR